jgi:Peptidoglycan-binding protein, CsiV
MKEKSASWSGVMLLLLAALTAVVPASAQQPPAPLQMYDVELVIFRNLSPSGTAEQWDLEAAEAGHGLAIPDDEPSPFATLAQPTPTATASFPPLASSKFKLTAVAETLRRSRNYQPLAHIGWTQPGYPRDAAQFVAINTMVPDTTGLVGQIALSRGRYLHLTLDLVYGPGGSAADTGQRFVMRQTRRMRSNERHYIDHPKFGVIALITPSAP